MQESNGRRTLCCLDSCAWNHLYLSIVQVEMDVEFPVLGESRAEKRRMEDVMSPLQEALASASPQGACALREALSAYVENETCRDDVDDPYAANPLLWAAERMLERMNMTVSIEAEAE